jgi:hypothetical protein
MVKDLMYMGCPSLESSLGVKLAFVTVMGDDIYSMSRGGGKSPMNILIDGVPGNLNQVNVGDIYSVEALTSMKYTSIYGMGKLLLITTKRGVPDNEQMPIEKAPGILSYGFTGFYKTRTFYAPKYDPANALSDQQSAVYWKPDVLTGKDGKSMLEYNNAGKGSYRVVVEGIDVDGRLGRAVYRYKVE